MSLRSRAQRHFRLQQVSYRKLIGGTIYPRFAALGVVLLVERGCSSGEAFRALEDLVAEGLAVRTLPAYWAGQPEGKSIVDAGWPGGSA